MQLDTHDLETLLEIQQLDLAIIRAKKARTELPQRVVVVKLRKKRDEIAAKLDQVLELQKTAEIEMTKVEDEDRGLAEKQERAQELIDAAGSDYRKVESHSKEMAGVAKRRDTLAEQIFSLNAELDKIKSVRAQLEGAIAASEAEEAKQRASYQTEDDQLIEAIRQSMAKRAELASVLPAELVELYDRTAAKAGGVGIGRLDDNRCGVCRSVLDGGRLIEVKAQAPLGTCPNCKRLLVIE